jgi:hypothetical protein
MNEPCWWSQPFPPDGAISSEGIRNQLGRPPVDPLTVFVRETAQNSWDARLPGVETTYRLELTTVSPLHRPSWERLLTPPAAIQDHLGVGRVVRTPNLRLLSVVDRGTKGLGGPVRADAVAGDRRDWVSFILNVGEKRDTFQGGGTYGYGKAVLYRLSRIGTILVYTRTEEPGQGLNSRLIGVAIGSSFTSTARVDEDARPYTGRHWWGTVLDDHVEPLQGDEADAMARTLGLRPFAADESGTTLVVIDPDLEDFTDVDAVADHLAETIAWHMWPVMLPERGVHRLVPEVRADGKVHSVPDPAATHPLRMFVAAYRRLDTDRAEVLECGRPRKRLGRFALDRRILLPMSSESVSKAAAFAGVDGEPHHVCLMRSPELVVRYYEGAGTSSVNQAYAGVFRADDELDEVYAAAEPPTHDNWVPDQLTGDAKTFVRMTFARLRERLSIFRAPVASTSGTRTGIALGAASNFLGGLVAAAFAEPDDRMPSRGAAGGSTGVSGAGSGSASSRGRSARAGAADDKIRVVALGQPRVEAQEGSVVVTQRFSVSGPGPAHLQARLSVATADGREDEAPAGADRPRVRSWRTPAGEVDTEDCTVRTPAEVELLVTPVADTITEIDVVGVVAAGAA